MYGLDSRYGYMYGQGKEQGKGYGTKTAAPFTFTTKHQLGLDG